MSRLDYVIKGFVIGDRTIKELVDDIEKFSSPVKKLIWDELCLTFDNIDCDLLEIKSPIEQALYLAWKNSGNIFYFKRFAKHELGIEPVVFIPQQEVRIGAKKYILDFLFSILLPNNKAINIAVECDGHDFHEKTKEQARHDKQRERALIKGGYNVIRFTGSEIYEDPYKCADEIAEVARALIKQYQL